MRTLVLDNTELGPGERWVTTDNGQAVVVGPDGMSVSPDAAPVKGTKKSLKKSKAPESKAPESKAPESKAPDPVKAELALKYLGIKSPGALAATRKALDSYNTNAVASGLAQMELHEYAALTGYLDTSYVEINHPLRNDGWNKYKNGETVGKTPVDETSAKGRALLATRDALNSALDKVPIHEGVVARVALLEEPGELQELLSKYKEGATITDKAFVSATSGGDETIERLKRGTLFPVEPNVKISITSKTGRAVDRPGLTRIADEKEVMFKAGTSFRVKSMKETAPAGKFPNGRERAPSYEIELEEV